MNTYEVIIYDSINDLSNNIGMFPASSACEAAEYALRSIGGAIPSGGDGTIYVKPKNCLQAFKFEITRG